MVLDGSCEPYQDKIESAIRIFSALASGIEDIPCTIAVAGDAEKDIRLHDLNGRLIMPESDGLPFTILVAER